MNGKFRYEGGSSALAVSLALVLSTGSGVAGAFAQEAGVRATVVSVKRDEIKRTVKLPATLRADEEVELYAKTSGYVSKVNVDIGAVVKTGDELLVIDVPEMADELRQAMSILEAKKSSVKALQAKSVQSLRMVDTAKAEVKRHEAQQRLDAINFERRQKLHSQGAIPQQQLDEARNALDIADAQLDIARARIEGAMAEHQAVLADVSVAESEVAVAESRMAHLQTLMLYTTIRAPFSGIITRRHVDTGTFVRSAAEGTTMPLLRIEKVSKLRLVMEVTEVDAPYVRVGTCVEAHIDAARSEPIQATVSRTSGSISPATRTMRVEVDLANDAGTLMAGMYARVRMELESARQAMIIPSKVIRSEEGQTMVLVVRQGKAETVPVSIGYDNGISAQVLSGLTGSEQIIESTSASINAGDAVRVVSTDQ
ncbi:MAG: efflux RND transporter periplasmic adaptor subunit [Planctomycetota bacterium]|jgi:RND family efflux transporter MFP subunit